jgi:hypothetical protein
MEVRMLGGESRKYVSLFVFVGNYVVQMGVTWQFPGRECPIFVYRPVPRSAWEPFFGLEGAQK